MRLLFWPGLCGLIFAGCAGNNSKPAPNTGTPDGRIAAESRAGRTNHPNIVVTPGSVVVGKVSLVNATSGFVVVTFPLGAMPVVDRRLNVYRGGLKVAELKVGKDQIDMHTVADIVTGECQAGDEVRED